MSDDLKGSDDPKLGEKMRAELDSGYRELMAKLQEKFVPEDDGTALDILFLVGLDVLSEHLGRLDAMACISGLPVEERAEMRHDSYMHGKQGEADEHAQECPDGECEGLKALRNELMVN